MVYNPRSGSPAPNSVTSAELADNAVTSAKIAAASVTAPKLADGVAFSDPVGSQQDFSQIGTTRKRVERWEFFKDSGNKRDLKRIRLYFDLKSDNVANTAELSGWLDNDADWNASDWYTGAGSPSCTSTQTATTFTAGFCEIDVSALSNGKHILNVALKSSAAAGVATSGTREYVYSVTAA